MKKKIKYFFIFIFFFKNYFLINQQIKFFKLWIFLKIINIDHNFFFSLNIIKSNSKSLKIL